MIGKVGTILVREYQCELYGVGRIAREASVMAIGVDEQPNKECLKRIGIGRSRPLKSLFSSSCSEVRKASVPYRDSKLTRLCNLQSGHGHVCEYENQKE
ncbi:hypothetical protein LOK49_LG02G00248 [Camellia lanceoleosa]|uniref:Uncharacterized protein n=1 Tax=Camellia lanceoleosa TaxID=1840588 RepID=A0ACC0IHF8_9ERIC|nr:hypothetical protein LOK49_LG02G00248 [Camellia lanceoleosa]